MEAWCLAFNVRWPEFADIADPMVQHAYFNLKVIVTCIES